MPVMEFSRMSVKTHIDLFTGIAGFTLACEWNGIQTEVFCEKDKRCQEFLRRTYPGIPIVSDIREFDGTKWRGRFILTAGVPCQPASRAGQQRGKDDDRWLWPEALRVVSEARPDWVLFENPLGINDVGLDGILADLEGLDYEVAPPLIIPACAVNSPQLRNRYWIVAHSKGNNDRGNTRSVQGKDEQQEGKGQEGRDAEPCSSSQGNVAHLLRSGLEESTGKRRDIESECKATERGSICDVADTMGKSFHREARNLEEKERGVSEESTISRSIGDSLVGSDGYMADTETATRFSLQDREKLESPTQDGRCDSDFWGNHVWLPCADGKFRRAPNDSFSVVDGLHRSVLAALGNSIVPQVAAEIIKAIAIVTEQGDEMEVDR